MPKMAAAASSGFAQDRPVQDYPGTVAHASLAPLLGVTPKETLKATYEDSIHNGGIFTFCSTAGCLAPTATIDSLNLECPVVAGKTCNAGLLNVDPQHQDLCDVHPSQSGQHLIAETIKQAYRAATR